MSVKVYNSSDSSCAAEHFRVYEFACKCGKKHEIKIDSVLAEKLEKLRSALGCSKIIITSGYRCPTHDKNVGGSGKGQHTTGKAADIVCYDKINNIIPSELVCCAAQDIGFGGIANIDKSHSAVHVDVASRKWFGDENISVTQSVCDDFYKYYNISQNDVYPSQSSKFITLNIDGITYEGVLTVKS